MSVRKRKWTTAAGEAKEAWIVDYSDAKGERHIETFTKKKDADRRHDEVRIDVRKGVHTPVNKSITVAVAAADWVKYVELEGREAPSHHGQLVLELSHAVGQIVTHLSSTSPC